MMLEWVLIVLLVVVVCFLLYKFHKIKYRKPSFIPDDFKKEIMGLEEEGRGAIFKKFDEIEERIDSLEKVVERHEKIIKSLVEELGG